MKKKVLILTASPERDKIIDELISDELTKRGFNVKVAPCLRQGRQAVLAFKPDIVVIAPVRNLYSQDFLDVLDDWGIGVVTRHTEASCDWQDWKKVDKAWKQELLGRYPYKAKAEIVWGDDEAQILNRRGTPFKTYAVGALALDIYFKKDLAKRFGPREDFNKERGLDNNKKTLVIGSPWGFADSAPDLQIPEIPAFNSDVEWRQIQLNMIKKAKDVLGDKWNVLMRPHPGVLMEPYETFAKDHNIPLDKETEAAKVLYHCDALIHAGSTMAMEMHCLNKPAFQFGDVNQKHPKNWWLLPDSPMSQISPIYQDVDKLINDIKNCKPKSNANKKALKRLETGRYGKMDGKATKRAADIIAKIDGKFKMRWPRATRDYSSPTVLKSEDIILMPATCGICGRSFKVIKMEWLKRLAQITQLTEQQKASLQVFNSLCPHCAARFFRPDAPMTKETIDNANRNNPGPAQQQAPAPQGPAAV
jgi:surface carbohydrate biosynthesis protein